ncbi:MAG: GNAT family N-acetyltransferase [Chloroflexota bacterium]
MALGNPDHPVGGLSVRRPEGVELRPLGRDDFPVALAMMRELYGLPDSEAEPHRAVYEAYVNDPDAAPFLAMADGEAAGLILFRFRRRLNRATFEGWVSDLFIREPFRRRGIGRMLLNAAIEEWRLRQGHAILLEAGDDRTAARQLYAAARFHEAGRLWELVPLRQAAVSSGAAVIRQVQLGDVEAVTRLLVELGRPVPAPERQAAVQRTFTQLVGGADLLASIAEVDGMPAGVVIAQLRWPFYTLEPQLWISELVVTEPARGRGIGRQLLSTALASAAERQAYGASVTAAPTREAAGRLLRVAGFDEVGSGYALDRS